MPSSLLVPEVPIGASELMRLKASASESVRMFAWLFA
jgi:hypothetical protein